MTTIGKSGDSALRNFLESFSILGTVKLKAGRIPGRNVLARSQGDFLDNTPLGVNDKPAPSAFEIKVFGLGVVVYGLSRRLVIGRFARGCPNLVSLVGQII